MENQLSILLEPISENRPCGEDLSFSSEFDRIQEARREDDPTVDYGEWQTTLKQADWRAVVDTCTELLSQRTKDLRVAAWLVEGQVKTVGLQGLHAGLDLMSGLLDRYGKDIHPVADDGDQEQRIGSVSWFSARMAALVRQVPLTGLEGNQFCLNDYESAHLLQAQIQKNPEISVEDRITLEKIASAAAKTDKGLYLTWIADADRCSAALVRFTDSLDKVFGEEAPSTTPLSQGIERVQQRLHSIARELGILNTPAAADEGRSMAQDQKFNMRPAPMIEGPIQSREQALQSLRAVAAFFRRTEPHSPVAYLADKAVQWGNMPLHAWLRNVVKDTGTLSHLEEMLGLDNSQDSAQTED